MPASCQWNWRLAPSPWLSSQPVLTPPAIPSSEGGVKIVCNAPRPPSTRCPSTETLPEGRIYAAVIATGRKARGPRAVDLLIAATALAANLPLYTRNTDDFRDVEQLLTIVGV